MSDPVTKEDLREAKDDLRREFTLAVGAVEKTVTTKIEALDRSLWLKLGGVIGANLVAAGVTWSAKDPQSFEGALDAVARAMGL
jgi:hypothetical protein